MPSQSQGLLAELTLGAYASGIISPFLASIRSGQNNFSLAGWKRGYSMDFNFTLLGSIGEVASKQYTLRLLQDSPRTNASWTLSLAISSCGFTTTLSSVQTPTAATFIVPPACSSQVASLLIYLSGGASIQPPSTTPTLTLQNRGNGSSSYSFTVLAEDGTSAPTFTLTLAQQLSNDTSFFMRVSGGGLPAPISLNSASPSFTVVTVFVGSTAAAGLDNSSLTVWAAGDNCAKDYNKPGVYGVQRIPSDLNAPQGRQNVGAFMGVDGNIWLYGTHGSYHALC
jgi:hypothetical protein